MTARLYKPLAEEREEDSPFEVHHPEPQDFVTAPDVNGIEFDPHPTIVEATIAQVRYPNGYVVSILAGAEPLGPDEYEVEILYPVTDEDGLPNVEFQGDTRFMCIDEVNIVLRDVCAWPPRPEEQ